LLVNEDLTGSIVDARIDRPAEYDMRRLARKQLVLTGANGVPPSVENGART
jgi:hypothetical protein